MFQDPSSVLARVSIPFGSHVAEFGAGGGSYTLALGKQVGEAGAVYAIDIQKDLLAKLENELHAKKIDNIHTIWGDIEAEGGSKLRDASIDWVVFASVLFQLPDRPAAIREALRILKPGGMLLVIDWKESFNNMGPASHDVFPEADAKRLLEQCGLGDIASHEVGMYHYAITAKKSV